MLKNLVRYIDPSGNGFARNKSMRVNGILYYFDRNGYRITDLTNRYRGPYSVQVDRVNGVMTVYADSARTIPVKTIRVSVGLAGTPTPTGNFTLSRSLRWQPLMGPSWGTVWNSCRRCRTGRNLCSFCSLRPGKLI